MHISTEHNPAPTTSTSLQQTKEKLLAEREAELAASAERIAALEQDVTLKADMLKGISQVWWLGLQGRAEQD